jgi:hypothetical protein
MHQRLTVSIIFIILFASGFNSCLSAQELHTYVDRDSVRVGDMIIYTLVLNSDESSQSISFPDEGHFEDEELVFINRNRHRISATRDSVVYRLQYFGTEDYRIPRLPVMLSNSTGTDTTVYSTPVPIFFKTIVAEGDEEFRPLKPIFDFAAAIWPWLVGLLLLTATGWLVYKWLQKREEKPEPVKIPDPVPFKDPLLMLQNELDKLSGEESPLKRRGFKVFYILLGDAIRAYFEDVYQINALEMTSGEILKALRDYPAEKEIISITRKVLNEADMVKFAKFEPDIPQADQALKVAYQFLEIASEVDKNRIEDMREKHAEQQELLTTEVQS